MTSVAGLVDLHDAESAACQVLPREVWDFVAGGSGAEHTLAANHAYLARLWLVPRVLAGAATATTAGDLPGTPVSAAVLDLVRTELEHAMVLTGCPNLARASELTVMREAV